jgi:CHAT domain-containing protein/Tfp pilus assembly protein PilF
MRKIIIIGLCLLLLPLYAIAESNLSHDENFKKAEALNNKGIELYNAGKYEEALPYAKQVLEIIEKTLGKNHPSTAQSLNNLALLYYETGRYSEAEPLLKRALEIKEKALGKEHPDTAISLNSLALLYDKTGRYSKAEPLYKRALEIHEKALGKEHPSTATSLNNLAALYYKTGRYSEVEPLLKRALEIHEKALGKEHPDTALSLNNLAELYDKTGRYSKAEPLLKRALEIREKALGKEHPDTAGSLNNLAELYYQVGRYDEAEPLYKRALDIYEKALGKEHPDTVLSLNNLAKLYRQTGRYDEAEPILKRALEIREKALDKDHPDTALSLNELAGLYYETGRYSEAEPLYKRALEIREKALGKEHPDTAQSLNNLALLYYNTRRNAEAETLLKRALEIHEKALGKEHPDTAVSLNNLAERYRQTGHYIKAEPLLKRALEIYEKALGKDHPLTATSLNNLAGLYYETGRYSEAEPLYKRALEIREKALGKEHPDTAQSLNNLALLYYNTRRNAEAETLLKRALEIYEKALGKDHPNTAGSLNNLALLYASTNNHIDSHRLFNRSVSIQDRNRKNTFLLLSDKQKLNYINQTDGYIHGFINHTVQYMADDNSVTTDTLNAWLKWKGVVMEAQGRLIDAVTYSDDPEIKQKFDELINTRRLLAKLQLSDPSSLKMSFDDYKQRIKELEGKKDNLEVELTRLSKDFALEKLVGKADITNISKVLPKDSVYLDFVNTTLYDFKEKKMGDSYYVVFVLVPESPPQVKLITITKESEINTHRNKYLTEMAKPDIHQGRVMPKIAKLNEEAKALYEKVLKPLEPYFKGKKSIYISPDGNLNLIPFEVFVMPDGKYLMENYEIDYVTAGRDIIRFTDTAKAENRVLVMADPDYDMGLEDKKKMFAELNLTSLKGEVSTALSEMEFPRLPETKEEADAIEKMLKDKYEVKNFQDKKAIEEVLLDTKKPRLVHLSTHGFFLEDEKLEPEDNIKFQSIDKIKPAMIENPMLRSGLVFAGVNKSIKEGRDDGILTAEKILGLRLKGTELVTLSACKTGTGNVNTGEGVFGLKRAFILSGAKTVVISLWSVPAKETTELMTDFYKLMEQGKTKSEALKQAKINMKAKQENPFYWGAFVMVGNPE